MTSTAATGLLNAENEDCQGAVGSSVMYLNCNPGVDMAEHG